MTFDMLYVLIVLVPFMVIMGYLINQNNKLKKRYEKIEQNLFSSQKKAGHLSKIKFPMGMNRDFIVTDNSIRRLESFMIALEEALGIGKQPVISKTYAPKLQKLKKLEKRAEKIKSEAFIKEGAEEVFP